ncbi:MAG: sulfite exporter TauE/SafE family protein [Spartobacteria bacterium]
MPPLADFTPFQWIIASLAALGLGMSKSGFGGMAMIGILLMAQIIPARESTGVILPMLILADVFAVRAFHHHAVWRVLWRIMPAAVAGVLVGWVAMPMIPAGLFAPVIGWIVIGLLGLMILQKCSLRLQEIAADHPVIAWPLGVMAGFTTMIANAAGAVMTIYLLACRLPKYEFVGTAAWFFFLINVFKVPFSMSLGLITPQTLIFNAVLAPAVIAGVFAGRYLLGKINQQAFEWLLIAMALAGSLRLALG